MVAYGEQPECTRKKCLQQIQHGQALGIDSRTIFGQEDCLC